GADVDVISVHLAQGGATQILIDAGLPGASDSVTIFGTAEADIINVTDLTIDFDLTHIDLSRVENLTLAGGAGSDVLTLTGSTVNESIRLLGEGDDDVISVTYPIVTGSIIVDGGTGEHDSLTVTLTLADA